MNLKELTLKAIHDVNRFRSPDVTEWVRQVDPVLRALGEAEVGSDRVVALYTDTSDIHTGIPMVHITTEYEVRGGGSTNDADIPMYIIESADPVAAATEYKRVADIQALEYDIEVTEKALGIKKERLNKLLLRHR